MATALVVRVQRHKTIGDSNSPLVYTLKRKSKDAKMFDLTRIAQDIEALGGMSAEDVEHVGKAIVRQIRQTLADGNSVRLDGLGIFRTTFKCRATEEAKDCTVKNIERVNIRFKVANTLRLVNDSIADTRGAANNIVFELVADDSSSSSSGGSSSGGESGGGETGGGETGGGGNPLG
ncbi:MAG: DNA-binding protein [Bacteroides sp.]|nr:DNA-binding protein [Bacteroides sp.]